MHLSLRWPPAKKGTALQACPCSQYLAVDQCRYPSLLGKRLPGKDDCFGCFKVNSQVRFVGPYQYVVFDTEMNIWCFKLHPIKLIPKNKNVNRYLYVDVLLDSFL
jgi:hypothetical protein